MLTVLKVAEGMYEGGTPFTARIVSGRSRQSSCSLSYRSISIYARKNCLELSSRENLLFESNECDGGIFFFLIKKKKMNRRGTTRLFDSFCLSFFFFCLSPLNHFEMGLQGQFSSRFEIVDQHFLKEMAEVSGLIEYVSNFFIYAKNEGS